MFNVDDLLSGKAKIQGGGTGKFARIRDLTGELLKAKGDACELTTLVDHVQKSMQFDSKVKAANYVTNALKSDKRFHNFKYGNRRMVVRVDADEEFIKKVQAHSEPTE